MHNNNDIEYNIVNRKNYSCINLNCINTIYKKRVKSIKKRWFYNIPN